MGGEVMQDQPWWSLPVVVAAMSGMAIGFWAWINRKGGERFKRNALLPPTWGEIFDRFDAQDAKIQERDKRIDELEDKLDSINKRMTMRDRAFGNVLAAAARAWPRDRPGPTFSKADLDVLGDDTVPPEWLMNAKSV